MEKRLTFGDQPDGNSDGQVDTRGENSDVMYIKHDGNILSTFLHTCSALRLFACFQYTPALPLPPSAQDSAPPAEDVQQTAATAAEPASDEVPSATSEVADELPGPREVPPSPTVRPSTPEAFYHDDPTVLLASPIIMAVPTAYEAATSAAAPEVEEPRAVETEEGPAAVPDVAAPSAEMPTPSPPPAAMAHGTPMAITPIPMASPIEQHLAEAAPALSPLPMASPMSVMEEDPAADVDQPAPSPAPAMQRSPLPAGTPLSFMSDAITAGMGPSASLPATPLSITASIMDAMGEQMSPFPADDEELADQYDELPTGSPASFGQAAAPLTPGGPQAMDEDEAMMDATPAGAAPSAAATPATFLSDVPYASSTPLAPGVSPMAAMAAVGPASVPHAAAPVFPRASDSAASFQGFTPMPESRTAASQDAESPAFTLPTADPNTPSLGMEPSASAMPPAPASTPMQELAPEPTDEPSTSMMEDCAAQDASACIGEGSDEQVAVTKTATPQASKATPSIAPKSAAKTPVGKSPLASKVTPMRAGLTPSRTAGTKATPTTKPATTPSGPSSSYVYVESRYKTPAASTTPAAKPRTPMAPADVASTPVAPTTTTMGTKSAKRVSIQTPEGPRSTAPQRKVDLTPHHTKSASRSAGPPAAGAKTPAAEVDSMAMEAAMPYPEQEQENQAAASNAADMQADVQPAANAERRAKVRLVSPKGPVPLMDTECRSVLQPAWRWVARQFVVTVCCRACCRLAWRWVARRTILWYTAERSLVVTARAGRRAPDVHPRCRAAAAAPRCGAQLPRAHRCLLQQGAAQQDRRWQRRTQVRCLKSAAPVLATPSTARAAANPFGCPPQVPQPAAARDPGCGGGQEEQGQDCHGHQQQGALARTALAAWITAAQPWAHCVLSYCWPALRCTLSPRLPAASTCRTWTCPPCASPPS